MEWANDRVLDPKVLNKGNKKSKVHTMPVSNGKSEVRITDNPSLENTGLSLYGPLFLSLSLYRELSFFH